MADILREAPLGQIIYYLSKGKYFAYPEEGDGFECPKAYADPDDLNTADDVEKPPTSPGPTHDPEKAELAVADDLSRLPTAPDVEHVAEGEMARVRTLPFTEARLQMDKSLSIERTHSRSILPQKTSDGVILVDWYTTDDPANPQNWSTLKKGFVAFQICIYTFAVYCSSAIYTSSEPGIMARFNVDETEAALGLALYVLGYGIGPLFFSPMSEVPRFGRNIPYVTSFTLFVIMAVPTALVDNYPGLMVLRFIQGFLGSSCLATGGASMQDMFNLIKLPYLMAAWVSFAYCGPALGPLISGFAVVAENWRWSLWEILWMSSPVLVLFYICLPETSSPNILLRRAERLRKKTGNKNLKSQSEIDQGNMKLSAVLWNAIIKPLEITIKDPAVAFTNLYTALTYGIYYSFFEVFPLVYPVYYGFNLGEMGLAFLCILVSCIIALSSYIAYLYYYIEPDIMKNGLRVQEHRLVPALFTVFGPTIGLFIFGWTARPSIHWIVSLIGITIYGASVFIIMQCLFIYLPLSYPQYAASLFAGNDFFRSALAFAAVLFARPMYVNMGVAEGVSLLGGLSVIGIIGMYILYFFGAKLRAKSRFAI
ncbi:MAG: hypothetical protein M1834_005890 [Cirrosporium novae-zelandiae]|nr:MAG: hypothetical protein M1834_005890 [Cirrosporium novae-zelandiae]